MGLLISPAEDGVEVGMRARETRQFYPRHG